MTEKKEQEKKEVKKQPKKAPVKSKKQEDKMIRIDLMIPVREDPDPKVQLLDSMEEMFTLAERVIACGNGLEIQEGNPVYRPTILYLKESLLPKMKKIIEEVSTNLPGMFYSVTQLVEYKDFR